MSIEVQIGEVELSIREPAAEPAGALILNHGRGTDENDLRPLLDELDPDRRLLAATTGAPLTGIPPGGRHWYVVERVGSPHRESFEIGYGGLTERLDGWLSEHGVDWSRTIIGGFSQGAVMSYATGLGEGRPRPAGVVALSGFVPEVDGWSLDGSAAGEVPVLIHHGSQDPIISVDFARQARGRIEKAGGEPAYEEFPIAHGITGEQIPLIREFIARALG